MLDPEDRKEAARGAHELIRPDREAQAVARRAHAALTDGSLTADLALALWATHHHWSVLETRLRSEIDAR